MYREPWCAVVHGIAKIRTWLSFWTEVRMWNSSVANRMFHKYTKKLFNLYYRVSSSTMSDSVTQLTVACQAPLSTELSRQEYWSRLPCLSPGGASWPGIELGSPTMQADSSSYELPRKPHFQLEHLWNLGVEECSSRTQVAPGNRSMNHSLPVSQLVFHPYPYFSSLLYQQSLSLWF